MDILKLRFLASLGAVLCVIAAPSITSAEVVYERDSLYSHIRVEDYRGIRTLYFNAAVESTMSVNDPLRGALEYTEFFHAAFAFKPDLKRVLVLGLGGGSTPKAFLARYPDVEVDVVEIDQVVIDVAERHFFLRESKNLKIIRDDARRYLARGGKKYDAIFVDAYLADYYGNYVPFHLATREFFEVAATRLTEGGVIGYNVVWGTLNWQDRSVRAIYKTMSDVFGQPCLFPVTSSRNMVLFGVKGGEMPSRSELLKAAREADQALGYLPKSISSLIANARLNYLDTRNVPVLTDDYAPVESLGAIR